ncbi:MAG: tetratricopeptide repeat protein, partial [Ferruginibacter sp.]
MLKRTIIFLVSFFVFITFSTKGIAQPTWTIDPFGKEKKPEKYESRKLGSEKTGDKKFSTTRHFIQNNVTHFNYFFNANNKVNSVVEKAKISSKDDYSKLLPFYPFSFTNTASQKQELDSVIYKCTAGILLHDLRNDWIDNLYLLIGKAYYYRKDFDSASLTFQFINYNLFPRKKGEDDSRVVGTNSSASGNNISIANVEKRNFFKKLVTLPPSRNDALVWLARSLIEQEEYGESAGLINTLQNDANLPKRLHNDLDEISAYWYFKQSVYDSSAIHLEKALSNADDKQDKSRREFLLAQLYEMNGNVDKASAFYNKASTHTVDPLMDIYARLNDAKMYRSGDNSKELNNSISNLLKLARKDKFETYRDIIYYSAGQLTLQKPDTTTAIIYFNKSVKYNESNIPYKNKSFLKLGDIAYKRKLYKLAANMYDSLEMSDTSFTENLATIQTRRSALTKIVILINTIETEDSLQRIAFLSPSDREAFVKKIVRKLRKENGLKDDGNNSGATPLAFDNKNNPPADLFSSSSTKGEWYFYNTSLKARGFSDFKTNWGVRPNVDNWRRKAAVDLVMKNAVINSNTPFGKATNNIPTSGTASGSNSQTTEITYDALVQHLPLTQAKIDSSNALLSTSLLGLAKLYQTEFEDYEEAIKTYEEYLRRFPTKLANGDVYLGLYYCYHKINNIERANYYKNLLNSKFSDTKAWQMLNNPTALNDKTKKPEATKLYDNIYNLFIEGRFDSAIAEKKKADVLFGVNYWTPQLLYIEAVYNVRQRNDSLAIAALTAMMQTYPQSALKEKAETMIDVIKRRKEIETYLTNLEITRAENDKLIVIDDNNKPAVKTQPTVITPPVQKLPVIKAPISIKDTLKAITHAASGMYVFKP